MPATVICPDCGQRRKSALHHCIPNSVEKQDRLKEKFGEFFEEHEN